MLISSECPTLDKLQAKTTGCLAGDELAALEKHVNECRQCKIALDKLARDSTQPKLADDDSGLRVVKSRIKKKGDGTGSGPRPRDLDGSLSFLEKSDDPDHMGRIGSYEIVELIGRGGMGVVLKGYEATLDRWVAIKVLSKQSAENDVARQRFLREARAVAAVVHPNVVAVHAVAQTGGLPYIVMEHVPGISLQERIDRDGPMSAEEIARIGCQIADGLEAAHACGLVHRDIKPGNILLLQGEDRVKIVDFGLARESQDTSLTRTGIVTGTPEFMSPEQAQAKPIDARTDLYSLGAVLFALCSGGPPFSKPTPMETLHSVVQDPPPSIKSLNSRIPDRLVVVIDRLLAKRPEDRYASAAEVAKVLREQPSRSMPWILVGAAVVSAGAALVAYLVR